MQDRPTALELLEAIRAFLEEDVGPGLKGRQAFHMRVTVNALKIIERELASEEEAVRHEHRRIATLLGRPPDPPPSLGETRAAVRSLNVELSRAIRAGKLDDRWDDTFQALSTTAAEKLRIANPGYEDVSS